MNSNKTFSKKKTIKIGKLFYLCCFEGGFWLRIFGYGFSGLNRKIHRAYFPERNGYVKYIYIGNWKFKILKP